MKMACLFAFPAALAMLCSCGAREEQEAEALEPSPLPVTAAVAAIDTLYEVIEVSGRITSARTQDLVAQIQGVISEAPGFEGMPVGEGEVLFRIASGSAGAELSAAYAEYQRSQAVYQFECDNYDGELTDQVSRMLRATTGLDNAEAALARARTGYGNATLTAGFDGLVSGVEVREGMTVYPGTVLGSLVDPASLRAEVDLDERQLSRCVVGYPAYVTLPSLGDSVVAGTVESVSPVVDPALRAGTVTIALPPVAGLRPGATARLEIVTAVHPDLVVIPEEAVLVRDARDMVFVIEGGKAQWRYITRGPSGRGWVAVAEGVSSGEQVITSGHYSLAHDAPVAVVQ
jgi:RND family efflux transporter MFP subunit